MDKVKLKLKKNFKKLIGKKVNDMVEVNEGVLNLLEMIIRSHDCCLSCSSHIKVVDKDGNEIYKTKDELPS